MSSHPSDINNDLQSEYDSDEESESNANDFEQYASGTTNNFIPDATDIASSSATQHGDNISCSRIVRDLSGNTTFELSYQNLRGHTYVTDDEARLISHALRTNTTIEILGIKGFQFTLNGFATFIEGAASCESLQHLKLGGKVNDRPVDIAQIQILANKLKEKNVHSFRSLELADYQIGFEGMISIFESLLDNSAIDAICMNNNVEDSDETEAEDSMSTSSSFERSNEVITPLACQLGERVTRVLHQNTTLQCLDLSFNPLGNEFIIIVANSLGTNTTLSELILNHTGITDVGAIALANALKSNTTLEGLNLNGNTFSKVGLQALGDAIKVNKSLISLEMLHHQGYVEWNLVSPSNVDFTYLAPFLKALEYNSTLQSLGVFDQDIFFEALLTHETKQSIIRSLEYNDTIIDFSGGTESAPELIQQILNENESKTRVAPKKGGHKRRTMYNWLSHNFNP